MLYKVKKDLSYSVDRTLHAGLISIDYTYTVRPTLTIALSHLLTNLDSDTALMTINVFSVSVCMSMKKRFKIFQHTNIN